MPQDSENTNLPYSSIKETPKPRTVKDFDPDQQPREKALKYGAGVLSTSELWAIILRTGTPGYPITDMCRDMMAANDGKLHFLMRRSRREIMKIRGIGTTKAIQIEAVMELVKRYQCEAIGERPIIRNSNDVWDIMRYEIGNLTHEEIWMLLLNRRNEVTDKQRLTTGTAVASLFDVKAAIKIAILGEACGIILCHNHPSGNLRPSPQDDNLTRSLKEAAKLFDINLLDHIIVCAGGHYSYRDEDRI